MALPALALLTLAIHAGPAPLGGASSAAAADDARYALANGCYGLRSQSLGRFVAKSGDGGYRASAGDVGQAEPFRMQATDLGKYLFFGKDGDFLAVGSQLTGGDRVETASTASEAAEWVVDVTGSGAFRITSRAKDKALAVSGDGGELVLADGGSAGDTALFSFEKASGCAVYPEVQVNVTGRPRGGSTRYTEVRGLLDAHMHMMAFEFLGGSVHCGRPWHPYGVTHALVDCPDHEPGGFGAVLENTISYGTPARPHDTTGWPTFKDWPHHASLTHEQSYYKWLERAWRGGLRLFVNLLVDNAVLCELYPHKRNPCDEMNTVRLELRRIYELQDYIDAQSGGPGKGWFRIVRSPYEARRIINQGKLAIVLGIEVSRLFGCTVQNDVPECDRDQIDRQMDEMYAQGVRSLELVNKFDNALTGVAGDEGTTGNVVNFGNFYETGRFWQLETCTGPGSDKEQTTPAHGHNEDALIAGIQLLLAPGTAPVYGEPPHCNTRGLTDLGEYLIRRMMKKGIMFDPDHMSHLARSQALALVGSKDYSGLVSSHSWSHESSLPPIYALGGVVTPYAGSSTSFAHAWRDTRKIRSKKHYYGFGYGADMNGFGAQGAPREGSEANPVRYPFKSFDGSATIDRQRSGERVYDINVDGVAHYGLYPDWVEDLRKIAGDQIVEDMARGPEAYLQMWERATGVAPESCRQAHGDFTSRGIGKVRLGQSPRGVLESAGQPAARAGRIYRYCVGAGRNRRGEVIVVFTSGERSGLVVSTAPGHRLEDVRPGSPVARLRGRARSIGSGLWVRRGRGGTTVVYGVRKGRVQFVAIARGSVGSKRSTLLRHLRLAGLR